MSKTIKVRWEADDGYCGGSRPQSFTLDLEDLGGGDERAARDALYEILDDELRERVTWIIKNEDEIMEAWRSAQTQEAKPDA